MALAIRDVREHDLDAVLALNNTAGRSILVLDAAQLRYFYEHADYFRVAEIDGQLAGFLIALRDGRDYGSPNYRWFDEHYPSFVYIDRIVVTPTARGRGYARRLYDDVFRHAARVGHECVMCEVNSEPPNPASDAFHLALGFVEVGSAAIHGGSKVVRYLARSTGVGNASG